MVPRGGEKALRVCFVAFFRHPVAPLALAAWLAGHPGTTLAIPMGGEQDERRRELRAPIELKVEYRRLNTFFADYTKNISRGGTFIGTERPLDVGTEFVFALGIPQLEEPLRLRGKVMWTTSVEDASKANPAGMGIEFLWDDEDERRTKESRVERLLTSELGETLAEKLLGRKPQL